MRHSRRASCCHPVFSLHAAVCCTFPTSATQLASQLPWAHPANPSSLPMQLLNFEITGGIPSTLPRLLDVLRPHMEVPGQQRAESQKA